MLVVTIMIPETGTHLCRVVFVYSIHRILAAEIDRKRGIRVTINIDGDHKRVTIKKKTGFDHQNGIGIHRSTV